MFDSSIRRGASLVSLTEVRKLLIAITRSIPTSEVMSRVSNTVLPAWPLTLPLKRDSASLIPHPSSFSSPSLRKFHHVPHREEEGKGQEEHHPEYDAQEHRFKEGRQVPYCIINLSAEVIGNTQQHLVKLSCLLSDRYHLGHHWREHAALLHWSSQRP